MFFDTSGLGFLIFIGFLGVLVWWIVRSIRKGIALARGEDKPYDIVTDWRTLRRLFISLLVIFLWFTVMPVRQELNDGAVRSSLRTEFNEVTEEDRVRVEDNLTREAREARLEELRIQRQIRQEEVEKEYEEVLRSRKEAEETREHDSSNKGDNKS